MLRDIRIIKSLYTKIKPGTLDYRPTPKQRSTLELLQYMSHASVVTLEGIKQGKMDTEKYQEAMKHTLQMKPEDFPARMDDQAKAMDSTFLLLTDNELNEELDLFNMGFKMTRAAWILEMVLKSLVAYKMQLFLYIKASGNPDIGSRDLWME
jgi:hypothetical protein